MYLISLIILLTILFVIDFGLTIFNRSPETTYHFVVYILLCTLMIHSAYNHSLITIIATQKMFLLVTIAILTSLMLFYRSLLPPLLSRFIYLTTMIIIALAFYLKQIILDQPLVWNDLKNGLVIDVVWNMVIQAHRFIFIIAFIGILGIIYLTLKEQKKTPLMTRFILATIAIFVFLFGINLEQQAMFEIKNIPQGTPDQVLQKMEGPLLYFLSTKDSQIMAMPEGYSERRMTKIIEELTAQYSNPQTNSKGTKKPAIIYILSEAFADPMMFTDSQWLADPMPNIRQLIQSNGGHLLVNNFGNGTANTEFSIISNLSYNLLKENTIPYNYLYTVSEKDWVDNTSIVSSMNRQGYQTTALHTHLKKGYHREDIFQKMAFEQMLFREDMSANKSDFFFYEESFLSDRTLYSYIIDQLKNKQQPQFIHALSMQNHFPYNDKEPIDDDTNLLKNSDTLPGGEELAIYARGIKKTDTATKEFLDLLKKIDSEINVVFYGDHLPALTKELYNNTSLTTYEDQHLAKFTTPYFIWNNQGKKIKTPPLVNPEFLTTSVLQSANLDLPIFHQFTTALAKNIPAFDKRHQIYFKNDQPAELTTTEEKILADYELLQYDHLFGSDYAKELFE